MLCVLTKDVCMNEGVSEWINEWMNELLNEWMNDMFVTIGLGENLVSERERKS